MSDAESDLEALLSGAGRRPEPPADVRQRVLAAVELEWQAGKRRRRWPLAAAAVLAAAVVAGVLLRPASTGFDVQLADTSALSLDGQTYSQGGVALELRPGSRMVAESPTRLIGVQGADLRLRAGTTVQWNGPGAVELAAGALYVDTHGRAGFRVATPGGLVEDVGTRFMVTVADGAVEVAMRDGMTRIHTPHGRFTATADASGGEVVRVEADRATKRTEPTSAARWDWIHAAHPGYTESSVPRLLAQIADDLGVRLAFASPGVEAAIANASLQGDLARLGPREALRVVLATSGLALQEDSAERILVAFESTPESD